MRTIFLPETDSTNDYLKRHASKCLEGSDRQPVCCYAFSQTKGRGRNGRSFASDDGGLYISFLRFGELPPANVTLVSSVRVLKILEDFFNIDLKIKWVNDILIGGRKCVGILAESAPGYHIIGVGINVYNRLPDDLSEKAASILLDGNPATHRRPADHNTLHELASRLADGWEQDIGEDWMDFYCLRSSVLGSSCVLSDVSGARIAEGVVVGFGEDGSIVFDEHGVVRTYCSGELLYSLAKA